MNEYTRSKILECDRIAREAERYLKEVDNRRKVAKDFGINIGTVSEIYNRRTSTKLTPDQINKMCDRMDAICHAQETLSENTRKRVGDRYGYSENVIRQLCLGGHYRTRVKAKRAPIDDFLRMPLTTSPANDWTYYGRLAC